MTLTIRFHHRKAILFVAMLLSFFVAMGQQKTITGKVTASQTKEPVVNASVLVKGTSRGAITNEQGNYSVLASPGETLVVSAVGFSIFERQVGNGLSIDIALIPDNKQMEEVVVTTALGIKREERALGYSATTLSGERLTDAVSSNWTDALSGKVAGLNLIRSNSGPTGSNKIILRGENNLTGDNEALIVVDGVVINNGSGRKTAISGEAVYGTSSDNMPADYGSGLNDINPEDIESVTVLKGPGAAALYGQRGANGAIIITTKSGKRKKSVTVTLNSNFSIEKVNRWPDLQYEYGQGLDGASYYSFGASADGPSTRSTSSAYGPRFEGQYFYQFDPYRFDTVNDVSQLVDSLRTLWRPYKNQTREYFETGKTATNTLTIDGNTKNTNARFSYTNVYNSWIMPNTGYNRNTLALSVNSKVTKKLQLSTKVNYTNKASDNLPGAGYGNQSIMYWYIFWQPNADLNWLKNYWLPGHKEKRILYPFSSFPENPYAVAYEFLNASNRNGVTGNVQAVYNFTSDLSVTVRTNADYAVEARNQKRPFDAGTKFPFGSYREQNISSQELSTDFLLRYQKKLNKDFNIGATLGGSTLTNKYDRKEVRADSLDQPYAYNFLNKGNKLDSLYDQEKFRINSLYALLTTSYKNYLYVDLSARQDWNSTLATPLRTSNAGFFYPALNLSYIVSDAHQLPHVIDFAKLRLSVASVGSGTTIPYRTAYNYETAGFFYRGGLKNPALLANPDLKPLRTNTYELGANVQMFNRRLTIDVAGYVGNTKNQILERILDRSSGYTREVINAGNVRNAGFELAINATPVSSKSSFKWSTNLVYSTNRNRIVSMPDSSVTLQLGPVGGGQIVARVGGSMGDLYGRGYVRAPDGQAVYNAATGYARITTDVKYLGNTIPKGKIGLENVFNYKIFRLSFLFDAQYGAVAHSLMHYKLAEQGKLTKTIPGRYNGIIGNGVIENADGTYRTNDVIARNIDEYYRSHMGIDNAEGNIFSTDFIKFREARFDVTLPPNFAKKISMQRVTLGVYGRDLFIWSSWPMFDPEFGTLNGTDIVRGFEVAQFPSTRTMGVNLIVVF